MKDGPGREEQTGEKAACSGEVVARGSPAWAGMRLGARGARGGAWNLVAESLASVSRENPDDGACGNLEGDYEVGQVASSLFRGKQPSRGSTGRLASLFGSVKPQLQPVYVPVPKVSHCVLLRMVH